MIKTHHKISKPVIDTQTLVHMTDRYNYADSHTDDQNFIQMNQADASDNSSRRRIDTDDYRHVHKFFMKM